MPRTDRADDEVTPIAGLGTVVDLGGPLADLTSGARVAALRRSS
jgi:hypothetical protein